MNKHVIFQGALLFAFIFGGNMALADAGQLCPELSMDSIVDEKWTIEKSLDLDYREQWFQHLSTLYELVGDRNDRLAAALLREYRNGGFGYARDYIDPHRMRFLAVVVGDPEAKHFVAEAHYSGTYGFEEDFEKAMQYYHKSAGMSYPDSLISLGNLYLAGDLVDRDLSLAMEYFESAHMHGSAWARVLMGDVMREQGRYEEAIEVYLDSGEKGIPLAYLKAAGVCLSHDLNHDRIVPLASLAAEGGNADAHGFLALLFLGSENVAEVDSEKALYHLEIALRTGRNGLRYELADRIMVDALNNEARQDHRSVRFRQKLSGVDSARASRVFEQLSRYVASTDK